MFRSNYFFIFGFFNIQCAIHSMIVIVNVLICCYFTQLRLHGCGYPLYDHLIKISKFCITLISVSQEFYFVCVCVCVCMFDCGFDVNCKPLSCDIWVSCSKLTKRLPKFGTNVLYNIFRIPPKAKFLFVDLLLRIYLFLLVSLKSNPVIS